MKRQVKYVNEIKNMYSYYRNNTNLVGQIEKKKLQISIQSKDVYTSRIPLSITMQIVEV